MNWILRYGYRDEADGLRTKCDRSVIVQMMRKVAIVRHRTRYSVTESRDVIMLIIMIGVIIFDYADRRDRHNHL
jgi:hypothetical protein